MTVEQGIIQNRTATSQLTDMMAAVAMQRGKGVFHLGPIDSSEEITFLRSLATAFGHSEKQIVQGSINRCNAFMVPRKIFSLCGKEFKFYEKDAIENIRKMGGLQKYVNKNDVYETNF